MTREEVVKYLKGYIPWADQHEVNIDALKSALDLLEREQYYKDLANSYEKTINKLTKAISEQATKTGWNNHQIACMLADLFGDTCACNYNGIDEWLSELCDFKDTCCPNPIGVACWEQFLKYSQSRYTECGYEVRNKNALQEPKTGHWIGIDEEPHEDYECDRCGYVCSTFTVYIKPHEEYKFCPNCGAKMSEIPTGSESEVSE